MSNSSGALRIGWAQGDITPAEPVAICGQFHSRVCEGVMDPLTTTALVLDDGATTVAMVSCDIVSISDELRDAVRGKVSADIAPDAIIMNATHTHTGPDVRLPDAAGGVISFDHGIDLPVMPVAKYIDFAAGRIAEAIDHAFASRAAGKIAFGIANAVVGRNRRWVNTAGASTMYGNTDDPQFSHIEGHEDHSVNVLATYADDGALTGVLVNVPCPSQVDEQLFQISADYWHDTRRSLRERYGDALYVLGQCSAAGDQSPRPIFEKRAWQRMRDLAARNERQTIARELTHAVTETLDIIEPTAVATGIEHRTLRIDLPLTRLTQAQVDDALAQATEYRAIYEREKNKLDTDPTLRDQPRWYMPVTAAHRRAAWFNGVAERFKLQQSGQTTKRVEAHILRLGDIVIVTNPFEYYLDHGEYIKCRSRAVQTFIVQLAGSGTYVPSVRSTQGGGYGSVPASNPLGPEAGRMLADKCIEVVNALFE
jgi:hypothetical protein